MARVRERPRLERQLRAAFRAGEAHASNLSDDAPYRDDVPDEDQYVAAIMAELKEQP